MERWRTGLAAGLLALLVGVKLLFPDLAQAVGDKAAALLNIQEYTLAYENTAATASDESVQPVEGHLIVEEGTSTGEFLLLPGSEPATEEEMPPVVAAFFARQEAFAGYPRPENVDYAYPELPFLWVQPVAGLSSSGFGYRVHPIHGDVRFHYGADIAADAGADIQAFADGIVSFAGCADGYGNYLVIDHGDGWTSLYAHCSYLYAAEGQVVEAGEKIALAGATGLVTGPHLHFELRRDGVYYNPEYYINLNE